MPLIFAVLMLHPPLGLKWPTLPTRQPTPAAWVMRSDYGTPLVQAKKNRFERLAQALSRTRQP